MNGYHCFSFTEKTFFRSVDPISNQNMSNFHFDLSLKLSQGEVHDFSGKVQKFSGEVRNDLGGGAHLSTPPLKIRPWFNHHFNMQKVGMVKKTEYGVCQKIVYFA